MEPFFHKMREDGHNAVVTLLALSLMRPLEETRIVTEQTIRMCLLKRHSIWLYIRWLPVQCLSFFANTNMHIYIERMCGWGEKKDRQLMDLQHHSIRVLRIHGNRTQNYRKVSNIRRTQNQNLNDSRLNMQLPLSNPLAQVMACGIKSLPESILTSYHWGPVAVTWEQFHV